MIKAGIVEECVRYELLDGLIVLKDRSKKGEPIDSVYEGHSLVVGLVSDFGLRLPERGCFMQSQGPIRIPPFHAPEPDGAIIKGKRRDYQRSPRFPPDTSCVIEVAHSSVEFDRNYKGRIYAEAEIPQFVLINLVDNNVEIFEKPDRSERIYLKIQIATPGKIIPLLLPDGSRLEIAVDDVLPSVIQ